VAVVTKPVNVALVIFVSVVKAKSSADSISFDGCPEGAVSGRDAVAIFPSGVPVLKKNGSADAGDAPNNPTKITAPATQAARRSMEPSHLVSLPSAECFASYQKR